MYRCILAKLLKSKHKENQTLESAKEKQHIPHTGTMTQMIMDFLRETMKARRQWNNIFKVVGEEKQWLNCVFRTLYTVKMFFRIKDKTKVSLDKG